MSPTPGIASHGWIEGLSGFSGWSEPSGCSVSVTPGCGVGKSSGSAAKQGTASRLVARTIEVIRVKIRFIICFSFRFMLFSCWQKDTTTRQYRPYRVVLLFSNTKRRVILRMRSDAFQSACDAASTKNKRMATQTNAVKSLSDEVDFSLSGSKCTVSARFLHGFKTCRGCKSLQNWIKGAEIAG